MATSPPIDAALLNPASTGTPAATVRPSQRSIDLREPGARRLGAAEQGPWGS
jgi:hypothetical protein